MKSFTFRGARRRAAVLVPILSGFFLVAGVASAETDVQAVKINFSAFFNAHTPAQKRVQLLQHGQQFAGELRQQEQTPAAQETTAAATDVQVHGDRATVTYTIELDGRPVLSDQQGEMVKQNGQWKVSDQTFCDIESMSGAPPAACGNHEH